MYPAISEGKSKGVQESGLHHKNNKILFFIAVCSLYFLSLFLEWLVQQLLAGIIKLGSIRDFWWLSPAEIYCYTIYVMLTNACRGHRQKQAIIGYII